MAQPHDEQYWDGVRAQYDVAPGFINLEHGYFGVQARPVFEAYLAQQRQVNLENAYYLRERFAQQAQLHRRRIAHRLTGLAAEQSAQ